MQFQHFLELKSLVLSFDSAHFTCDVSNVGSRAQFRQITPIEQHIKTINKVGNEQ